MIPVRRTDQTFDALVIGRAGMDLYPLPIGTKTKDATSFASDMGGSAGNIAAAMARQGCRVALAAPVSKDPVGDFVRARLKEFGISHFGSVVEGAERTSLALAETVSQGSETVIYRNGAADFALSFEDISGVVADAACVVTSGTGLARDPSRDATLRAMKASPYAVLDLDYRPYSWPDLSETSRVYAKAVAAADMVVGNTEEFDVLAPGQAAIEVAQGLSDDGRAVLLKAGSEGCNVFLPGRAPEFVPAFKVEALKPFGAGDAFLGNTLVALQSGQDVTTAIRYGAAAAALVVSKQGCASAMPRPQEITDFLANAETR